MKRFVTTSGAPRLPIDEHQGLTLRFFGTFSVTRGGQPLPKMHTRKDEWLLAILVLYAVDTSIDRTRLAGMLWPNAHESGALGNLRRSLTFLRSALGPEANRIQSPTPRSLRIDLAGALCDLIAFDQAIVRGDDGSLVDAARLYADSLMLGCFEDWVLGPRAAREMAAITALETLAARRRERGDLAGATECLRRTLDLDPLRETTVRALMKVLAAQDCHAAAGEVYQAFRRTLRRGLNAEPAPETVHLSRRLLDAGRQRGTTPRTVGVTLEGREELPLPVPHARLIGRIAERESIIARLEQSRLVTLTGTGGVGKTRLSLAVAEAVRADFADGAAFIDLAPLSDAALLTTTLIGALGIRERNDLTHTAVLEAFLQPRRMLLILDNCEHLLDDCSRLAQSLLRACPHLRILATSREALRAPAEVVWSVPGLAPEDAHELFAERAGQASLAFQMTLINTAAVGRICARLECLPLAIEMAAARTRGMSASQIAANLDGVFRLLNLPSANLETRHQTLEATFKWSYDLLTEAERLLLTRLSIFAGGWTLDAAEAVCGTEPLQSGAVLEALLGLVDKSLVAYAENATGDGRYRLLEMTRAYAAGLLPSSDFAALANYHADFFEHRAEAVRLLQHNPAEAEALTGLELELPNIRAALRWCQSSAAIERGLLLANGLGRFWLMRGHLTEGRQWLATLLLSAEGRALPPLTLARALNGSANLAHAQSDFDTAFEQLRKSLVLYEELDDPNRLATTLYNMGECLQLKGDNSSAVRYLHESIDVSRKLNAPGQIAMCRLILGKIAEAEEDLEGAQAYYETILAHFEEAADKFLIAAVSLRLAVVQEKRCRKMPELDADFGDAKIAFLHRSLRLFHEMNHVSQVADCLEALATFTARIEDFDTMACLYGTANTLRASRDGTPMLEETRAALIEDTARARAALGDAAFDSAWGQGRTMTMDEAVAFALAG